MSIEKISVIERKITGKEEAGRIKRQGLVPAVVYGLKKGSVPISVQPKEVVRIFHSEKGLNTLLELTLEGSKDSAYVMIKDLARHPVTDRLIHVDFLRVDMAEVIETTVPLNFVGTAKGVKEGGALQIVRYEIPVSCLPKDLPGQIDLSVDDLDMDDSLRVEDVVFPEGVKPLMDPQRVLAVIHAQEAEEEEEVEEEIEVAEEEEPEEE